MSWRAAGDRQTIATVGKYKIPLKLFAQEVKLRALQVKDKTGAEPDLEEVASVVLDEQIRHALIVQEAQRLGLTVSDAQVRDHLRQAFQDKNGTFDKAQYDLFLRFSGITESDLIQKTRQDLLSIQLIEALFSGITIPGSMVDALLQWQFQKREVRVGSVVYADFKNLAVPTLAQIQDFYETHQDLFTIPESRDFTVLLLDAQRLSRKLELSAKHKKMVAQAPKKEKAAMTARLQREAADVKTADIANKIQDAIAAGEKLEEIAQHHQLSLLSLPAFNLEDRSAPGLNESHLEALLQDGFTAAEGDAPTTHEVADNTYMFLQLDRVQAPQLPPLESVQGAVAAAWKKEQQQMQAQKRAEDIAAKVSTTAPLTDAIQTRVYKLDKNAPDSGVPITLQQALFAAQAGQVIVFKDTDQFWIAQVARIIPAASEDLEKNKPAFSWHATRLLVGDSMVLLLQDLEKRHPVRHNVAALRSLAG